MGCWFGWVSWANGSAGPKPTHDPAKSQMVTAGPAAWGHMSVDRTARCALRVVHRTVQDVRASPAHSSLSQPASSVFFFLPSFFFFLIQLPLIVLMFSILFFFGPGPLVLLVERIDSYTVVVVLYRINRHVFRNKRRREILGFWGSLTPPMMYILIPNMKIYITENPNSRCGIDPMFLYRKS